jgi:hypothetical protein
MADLIPVDPPEMTPVVVKRLPRRVEVIDLLEGVSHLMDRHFEVPGSRVRFGVSTLLLLLPGLGDLISTMISLFIVSVAVHHYRVPRIVAARMLVNTLLDAAICAVPGVGNVWDVWFKADTRNVNLLRPYASLTAGDQPPSTWKHWLYVVGLLLLCVAALALVVVGAVALIGMLVRALQGEAA